MNPQAAGKFYINSILINFLNIIDIILTSPHLLSLCKPCFILNVCICICMHAQLCPTLCDSVNCSLPGSPCSWDSPGKNIGMGCHFLLQGNHPHPRIKPMSPLSPALAGRFFTPVPPGKPNIYIYEIMKIFFISFYKIFKYYTPLTVITKYQLFSPCCIVHPWACLNPNSLCLPLPYPYTAGSPTLAPLVTTGLFSISMGLLLFCYITSLLYFSDSIHKRYHRVFVFLCLTCPFLKGNVMINLFSTWRDHNIWPNTSLVIMMKVYFGKDQHSNQ